LSRRLCAIRSLRTEELARGVEPVTVRRFIMLCRQSTVTLPLRLAVSAQLRTAALQLVALGVNASEPGRTAVKAEDARTSMRLPFGDRIVPSDVTSLSPRSVGGSPDLRRCASSRSVIKVIAVALARCARPMFPERQRYNLRRGISIARTKKLRVFSSPSTIGVWRQLDDTRPFGGFPGGHRNLEYDN
jgi:hypothetical protein